jgi:hypothetical protein
LAIPTAEKTDPIQDKDTLCVTTFSYVGNINHHRDDNDTSDICMATIGKALCEACSIVNEDISVELVSAYELKVSDQNVKPDSVKIRGQLIIKGSSEYTMSHSAMVLSLKKSFKKLSFKIPSNKFKAFHRGSRLFCLRSMLLTIPIKSSAALLLESTPIGMTSSTTSG